MYYSKVTSQNNRYIAACIMMKSVVYVWAYYNCYCVCAITSRCTWATAAEADTVRVQFGLTTWN